MPLPLLAMAIGGGIGAGIGAATGGGDKIWQGALTGGAGGAMLGGFGGGGMNLQQAANIGQNFLATSGGALAAKGATTAAGTGLGTWGNMAMLGGMGLSLAQTFGSKAIPGGYAPSEKIPLTPRAKKLETALFTETKKEMERAELGLLPPNMAVPIIGRMRVAAEEAAGQAGKMISRGAARDEARGGGLVAGSLAAVGSEMEGTIGLERTRADMVREQYINAINRATNIYAGEMQVPMMRTRSAYYQAGAQQFQQAQQGQALGDIARMVGLMQLYGRVA
jgi:hypothetical protein